MTANSPRMRREAKTLTATIRLYCRGHHGSPRNALCPSCQQLLDYALLRLSRCPYQEAKPTCANCPIHCYGSTEREQIKAVMRYAGPRMLLHNPILTIMHLVDGLRKPKPRPKKDQETQTT